MKIHGVIYLITNLINKRVYIGQTTNKNPRDRFSQHKYESKKPKPKFAISRAIKKHGKDNFSFEIIAVAYNQTELNTLEEKLIIQYKSHISKNGYNINYKSQGKGSLSEATKKKQSVIANTPERIYISSNNGLLTRGSKLKIETSSSVYVGVHKNKNRWIAQISIHRKRLNLGRFRAEQDAAMAYDISAIKYFGNECKLNFPKLREQYINNEIISEKSLKIKNKECPVGISYLKACNRWRARYNNKNRYCLTLEEAQAALNLLKSQTQ